MHPTDSSAPRQLAARRALDVGLVVAAAPVVLPIAAMAAAAVLLDSGRPVLYRGRRVGRDGKPFAALKFRSMRTDNAGRRVTAGDDDRITRVGRHLRKWKLDELPQLLNVLRGDMAIVGPRPEDPSYVAHYSAAQRRILAHRPGITSPSSLAFRNEEQLLAGVGDVERYYVERLMPAKIERDLAYFDRASVVGDLALILRTLRGIVTDHEAPALDPETAGEGAVAGAIPPTTAGSVAPLRVALVTGTYRVGGAERQLVRLARELHALGHRVEVIALVDHGPLAAELDVAGVARWSCHQRPYFVRAGALALPDPRALVPFVRLAAHLRRTSPDVCHSQLADANWVAMPLARLARVPVRIAGRRGQTAAFLGTRGKRLAARLATRNATAVVANAAFLADEVVRDERMPRHRVHVIPNGVELPTLDRAVLNGTHTAAPTAPVRALTIANLIPYKGHADLLRALAQMSEPPLLRCAGEGPARADLERLIHELGLGAHVQLLGTVADAAALYATTDIAVLASHTEGLPNAVLEAMAAGRPVVATAVGGTPEVLDDDVQGLLVPPHDPVALAHALERLCKDAELREQMGRAARARAEEFGWNRCATSHIDLYRTLLGSGTAPAAAATATSAHPQPTHQQPTRPQPTRPQPTQPDPSEKRQP